MLIITFESNFSAAGYSQETGITWPIVIDESRELYGRYRMHRAGFWDLWGPRTWQVYFKQLFKGNLPRKTTGDIHQRGGDVLIDPSGKIKLHHVGAGPADRPTVATILDIVSTSDNSGNNGGEQ